MSTLRKTLLIGLVSLVCFFPDQVRADPRRVVILYSSSPADSSSKSLETAHALESQIRSQKPNTQVILKDTDEFLPQVLKWTSRQFYWLLDKVSPRLLDRHFSNTLKKGDQASKLQHLSPVSPRKKLLTYLDSVHPDSIIATHYGAAQTLGALRESQHLNSTPISWVNSEYVTGYFPRISKALDRTFLPHGELEKIWKESGVDAERIAPVSLKGTADFALDPAFRPKQLPADFGKESGTPARGMKEALAQLEKDAPADVEVLFSYSSTFDDIYIDTNGNPFGHTALRVRDKVYTANHLAQQGVEDRLMHDPSLEDYLAGTSRSYQNQQSGGSFGLSYARDTLGFRIKGFSPEALDAMQAAAEKIQEEFRAGLCSWDAKKNNCVDLVSKILKAGGVDSDSLPGPKGKFSMPLDQFDRLFRRFEPDAKFRTELVMYGRLPGSQHEFRYSRFPISLFQPIRSITHVARDPWMDPLEKKATRRIVGYPNDDRVHYEKTHPLSYTARYRCNELFRRIIGGHVRTDMEQ